MTLILTCVTRDCVYQVSDRRVTSFNPPHHVLDDEINKAVFVNGRMAFGYTGVSRIGTDSTDLWLTRTAASAATHDLAAISYKIQDEATRVFKHMPLASRFKRHAFQGVGWVTDPEGSHLRPTVITIQNALDPNTEDWLPEALPEFKCGVRFPSLRGSQFHLTGVGLRPSSAERGAVVALIRKCVHRRVRRQEAVLTGLAMAIRWLARNREPNSPIGYNLMAVSIPKQAAEEAYRSRGSMLLFSGPMSDVATFLDMPATGRTERFGPNAVFEGSSMTGFKYGPISA